MLIIEIKDGESIDRAVKRYKRKYTRVGLMKEIRSRKHYTKPSVRRRNEMLKAIYKKKKMSDLQP